MSLSPVWHAIIFTPDQVSRLEHLKFEDEFDLLYKSSGTPQGMALYGLKSFTSHPVFYLSPESTPYIQTVLEKFDGISCNPPPLSEIILLGGDLYSRPDLPASHIPMPRYSHWLPPTM